MMDGRDVSVIRDKPVHWQMMPISHHLPLAYLTRLELPSQNPTPTGNTTAGTSESTPDLPVDSVRVRHSWFPSPDTVLRQTDNPRAEIGWGETQPAK